MERAQNVSSINCDQESEIPIKNEIKQEIKNEPLEIDKVHEGLNDDVIKRAADVTNISFDDDKSIQKESKMYTYTCVWDVFTIIKF